MVELLLKHGADLQAANDDGKTAATLAREKGDTGLLTLLED